MAKMLRNISNLLPTVFYMLCGALISMVYFELTAESRIGLPLEGKAPRKYSEHQMKLQHCACKEVLENFKLLQKKTLKIEKELIFEKNKLRTILQQLQEESISFPFEKPTSGQHKGGKDRMGKNDIKEFKSKGSNREILEKTKFPVWSFSREFIFKPSVIVDKPRVPTNKSNDIGAKRVISRGFTQACLYLKKKLKTNGCDMVHGSLSINPGLGLNLAFILQVKRKASVWWVKVNGRFKFDQRFAIDHANIIKNQNEIHIITMISDEIPLSRLKSFLEMLKALKMNGEKLYVYFSIYANTEKLETFKTCIHESKKNLNNTFVKISHVKEKFERAAARHHGVSLLPARNVVILFADIDITFDHGFLQRCQSYAQAGKSAYFPIVFSLYNPKFYPKTPSKMYVISKKRGFWRTGGLGNICVYKSDYSAVGGFDTNITGWGSEDDDLYER